MDINEDIALFDADDNIEERIKPLIKLYSNGILYTRITQLLQKYPPQRVYQLISGRAPLDLLSEWKQELIDERLRKWCIEQKRAHEKLTIEKVFIQASKLAKECRSKIKITKKWTMKFLKRNGVTSKKHIPKSWGSLNLLQVI